MGYEELAANLFRATQTEAKIKRDNIQGKNEANKTHYHVAKKSEILLKDWVELCLRICQHHPRVLSRLNANKRN